MTEIEELLVRITGDYSGLKTATSKANAELASVGSSGGSVSGGSRAAGKESKDAEAAAKDAEKAGKDAEVAGKEASVGMKDAEAAAKGLGKAAGGAGSGLFSMIGGLTGLPPQAALAVGAIAAVVAISYAAVQTADAVNIQEGKLSTALKDHGESYDKLKPKIDAAIKSNEDYGYTASDTRDMVTKLTEAGISYSQVQDAMGPIMDLARAKNISLSDATEIYTKAMMGSAKGLKDLGIILPSVSAAAADVTKATAAETAAEKALAVAQGGVKTASQNLKDKQAALAIEEDKLKGKHHLTAAEALALQKAHEAVTAASDKLKTAQGKVASESDKLKEAQKALTLAQQGGVDKGARLAAVNKDLEKAVGGQKKNVSDIQVDQAKLNDAWEKFSVKVAPLVHTAFADLIDFGTELVDILTNAIDGVGQLNDDLGRLGSTIQNSPLHQLSNTLSGAASTVGSWIPKFASGGIVSGRTGGVHAIIGEGGEDEAVIPRHLWPALGKGGGGNNVTLTVINPKPEPASTSVQRELLKLAALGYVS